jgi:hypothetical protein
MGASLRRRQSMFAELTTAGRTRGRVGGVYEKMKGFAANTLFHSARAHRRGVRL